MIILTVENDIKKVNCYSSNGQMFILIFNHLLHHIVFWPTHSNSISFYVLTCSFYVLTCSFYVYMYYMHVANLLNFTLNLKKSHVRKLFFFQISIHLSDYFVVGLYSHIYVIWKRNAEKHIIIIMNNHLPV